MRNPIALFCFLAFSLSWLISFGLAAAIPVGSLSPEEINLYHALAAFGPTFAALVTIRRHYGEAGLRLLAKRLRLGFNNRTVFALALSPLLFLALVCWCIVLPKDNGLISETLPNRSSATYNPFYFGHSRCLPTRYLKRSVGGAFCCRNCNGSLPPGRLRFI